MMGRWSNTGPRFYTPHQDVELPVMVSHMTKNYYSLNFADWLVTTGTMTIPSFPSTKTGTIYCNTWRPGLIKRIA